MLLAPCTGWKRDVRRRLDARIVHIVRIVRIVRIVPGVRKAVKWRSPLCGVEGQGWFLGIHCELRQSGFLPRHVAVSSLRKVFGDFR